MIYNTLNYHKRKRPKEAAPGVSLTVPDQTMSLTEILRRYVRGEPITTGREPIYESDFEYEGGGINPKTLDISEVHEMKRKNSEYLIKTKKEEDEKSKKSRDEALRERYRLEFEAETKKKATASQRLDDQTITT